jgi:hypothetical protein
VLKRVCRSSVLSYSFLDSGIPLQMVRRFRLMGSTVESKSHLLLPPTVCSGIYKNKIFYLQKIILCPRYMFSILIFNVCSGSKQLLVIEFVTANEQKHIV